MGPTPVVQVRLAVEQIEFLDSLPGTRSEAIRHCVDFTKGSRASYGTIGEVAKNVEPAVSTEFVSERTAPYRFTVDECEHKWRDQANKCRLCGHQR